LVHPIIGDTPVGEIDAIGAHPAGENLPRRATLKFTSSKRHDVGAVEHYEAMDYEDVLATPPKCVRAP
jgi:hypothetical protein